MGKRGKYPGVEVSKGKIRINFRLEGQLRRKALGLEPNKENMEYAANLAAEVRSRIKRGTFHWADFWPEEEQEHATPTFLSISRQYLASIKHLAPATVQGYRKILNSYFIPWLGNTPIDRITYGVLAELVNEREWESNKTRNNALTPLKGVLELAFLDGHIPNNPADRLKARKSQKPVPDPFTIQEITNILDWMKDRPVWRNYFELAFFTGLRTSELVALRWGDMDWPSGLLRIQRAKVRREIKETKTGTVRDIELNSRALAALTRQKEHTFLGSEWVFLHPATKEPINDDKPPRLVFTSCLKALKLRHRATYQTRHTFATMNLMAGANPMWVSRQMGHSNMRMTLEVYARWIDSEGRGETSKLERHLGEHLGEHPGESRGS